MAPWGATQFGMIARCQLLGQFRRHHIPFCSDSGWSMMAIREIFIAFYSNATSILQSIYRHPVSKPNLLSKRALPEKGNQTRNRLGSYPARLSRNFFITDGPVRAVSRVGPPSF